MPFSSPLLVSAASSLTDVLPRIGQAWARQTQQTPPRFNFAGSGVLVKQLKAGAPSDVFVSAAKKEMDELQAAHLLAFAPTVFAGNRFVLIAPAQNARFVVQTWADLQNPRVRRIAISNPETVPSGRIAREVLLRRKLWQVVQSKLVRGENVRQTLSYAARGDADAALVFATDAQVEKNRVRVVAYAKSGTDYAPTVYPAAVLSASRQRAAAQGFVQFLGQKPAQTLLREYGFSPPPLPPAAADAAR